MEQQEADIIKAAGNAVIAKYEAEADRLVKSNQFRAASDAVAMATGATACLSAILRALADEVLADRATA